MLHPVHILRAAALSDPAMPLADLAHAAMSKLLADAPPHLSQEATRPPIFILGTTLGCLETDREYDRSRLPTARYASPAAFARTLPSTLAAQLAIAFHLTGPAMIVSAGNVSAAAALRRAVNWMQHLHHPFAIAGGFEHLTQNPALPATTRIALLLLSIAPTQNSLGKLLCPDLVPTDLGALHDASLDHLIGWVQNPATSVTLLNGVMLGPPLLDSYAR